MGESNFHRLERARCPSARGQASTRFPIKTDSLDQAGGPPPHYIFIVQAAEGPIKTTRSPPRSNRHGCARRSGMRSRCRLLGESLKQPPLNKGTCEMYPAPPGKHRTDIKQQARLSTLSLLATCMLVFAVLPSSILHISCLQHQTVCAYICPSFWPIFPRHALDSHI